MTESPTPNPAPVPTASASGIFSGCGLTLLLHLAVSIAVILIGGAVAKDGFYAVFAFWIFLGFLQWPYLYPAIRFSKSRGWPGIVLGLWIAGVITLALNLANLGLMLIPVAIEKLTGNSGPNVTYSGNDSRVISVDPTHIVVREGLGGAGGYPPSSDTETFVVVADTKFDFRGPAWREQTRAAGMDWLKAGRHVNVNYVFRDHLKTATFVTIWVETKEP